MKYFAGLIKVEFGLDLGINLTAQISQKLNDAGKRLANLNARSATRFINLGAKPSFGVIDKANKGSRLRFKSPKFR